MMNNEENPLN